MLEAFGERQQELLALLLRQKDGLTLDDLADRLGIARTAVRQHVTALERDGYVGPGELRPTGGRPGRFYVLTDRGIELFPKQYSWFSGLVLQAFRQERGEAGLTAWLRDLAGVVAVSLHGTMAASAPAERVGATVTAMNELGYAAAIAADGAEIVATNCVYHQLARTVPEVCQFDIALLEGLTGKSVSQSACMVHGDSTCCFRLS